MPSKERLSKKPKKTEKEMSSYTIRRLQKSSKSMLVLDLGSSSREADQITTVKIDVTIMVEPNFSGRVRATNSGWVDVLLNMLKNRTSSIVSPMHR
jgi:hypothetical protein